MRFAHLKDLDGAASGLHLVSDSGSVINALLSVPQASS
jgi:hypothetical protein